ncbi:hypothetical protein ACJX0J_039900 [Zea mays]
MDQQAMIDADFLEPTVLLDETHYQEGLGVKICERFSALAYLLACILHIQLSHGYVSLCYSIFGCCLVGDKDSILLFGHAYMQGALIIIFSQLYPFLLMMQETLPNNIGYPIMDYYVKHRKPFKEAGPLEDNWIYADLQYMGHNTSQQVLQRKWEGSAFAF